MIHNAWLRTLEDGVHTADVFQKGISSGMGPVGTQAFAAAVIERLGQRPRQLPAQAFATSSSQLTTQPSATPTPQQKTLDGVDVFVQSELLPAGLGRRLSRLQSSRLQLQMISNRGVKVWPNGHPETFCTDHWRCRFVRRDGQQPGFEDVLALLAAVHGAGLEVVKTEHLYRFDGEPGYSLGQGQ
jgi:isocitrate dehydrogenase